MSRLIAKMLSNGLAGKVKITPVGRQLDALYEIFRDPEIDLMITTIDPPGTFAAFVEEARKRCRRIRVILLSDRGETFSLKCVDAIVLRENQRLVSTLLNKVRDLLTAAA